MKLHACAHCPRRALPVCEVSALWRIHVVVSGSKLRCCQPLFNLVTARHTPGMHYLAIDHHAGCAHHAVAHDVAQLFHLFQLDCHAFGLGDLVDKRNGGFAVGTTGAEYFDVHESSLSLKRSQNKIEVKNLPLCQLSYSTALNTNPTSRMPLATTATKVAISLIFSTLRRMIISGSERAMTLIMKASTVPSAAPLASRAYTIGITPAALVYIGTPMTTASGTDHQASLPMKLARKSSGT